MHSACLASGKYCLVGTHSLTVFLLAVTSPELVKRSVLEWLQEGI